MAKKIDSDLNVQSLALNEVIDFVESNFEGQLHKVDVPIPYIQGAPGGGKTESIRALANSRDCGFLSTHFALKLIEELGGLPNFSTIRVNGEDVQSTDWTIPDIVKNLSHLSNIAIVKEKGGYFVRHKVSNEIKLAILDEDAEILAKYDEKYFDIEQIEGDKKERWVCWLLDDMHLCSATHMAMLYEILTEHKIRDKALPNNVVIVLAGNTSQKAGAKTTFSAITNRCALLPVVTDFDYWYVNYAVPQKLHPVVRSFLNNNSYRQYFHEEEQIDAAWASPRAWTRFANTLEALEEKLPNGKLEKNMLRYIAASHVGKAAAGTFSAYYTLYTNFDTVKIMKDYKKFKETYLGANYDPSNLYTLAFALISEYFSKTPTYREKNKYNLALGSIIHDFYEGNDSQKYSEISILILKEMQTIFQNQSKGEFNAFLADILKIDASMISEIARDIKKVGN